MKNLFRKKSADSDAAGLSTGQGRVLIVDDSPTEVHILKNILEKAGFLVESASSGEDGIVAARATHPDVILMDVVMPGLNGFQATRQLRNDPGTADIPVIMVTTKDQDSDKSWGLRQGAEAYLVKPVKAAELLDRIKAVLGG